MSILTCGICGSESEQLKDWKQLFITAVDKPDEITTVYLCPSCYRSKIRAELQTTEDLSIRTNIPKENKTKKEIVGLTLRDFLQTEEYLNMNDVDFYNEDNEKIADYLPVMSYKIKDIEIRKNKPVKIIIQTEKERSS